MKLLPFRSAGSSLVFPSSPTVSDRHRFLQQTSKATLLFFLVFFCRAARVSTILHQIAPYPRNSILDKGSPLFRSFLASASPAKYESQYHLTSPNYQKPEWIRRVRLHQHTYFPSRLESLASIHPRYSTAKSSSAASPPSVVALSPSLPSRSVLSVKSISSSPTTAGCKGHSSRQAGELDIGSRERKRTIYIHDVAGGAWKKTSLSTICPHIFHAKDRLQHDSNQSRNEFAPSLNFPSFLYIKGPNIQIWLPPIFQSSFSSTKRFFCMFFEQKKREFPPLKSTTMEKQKPLVVFVLGGPGSGKGTQCERIMKEFKFTHISAGDCLREERNTEGSEFKELIDTYIKEGKIVPVDVTVQLLKKKMQKNGWEKGRFLIDGFPRNQDNLDGWFRLMNENEVDVRFCLTFECTEEEMERRLLSRGKSSGRSDDNIDSIKKRFKTFTDETKPIIEWFEKQNKCKRVDAMRNVDEVWADVKETFQHIQ